MGQSNTKQTPLYKDVVTYQYEELPYDFLSEKAVQFLEEETSLDERGYIDLRGNSVDDIEPDEIWPTLTALYMSTTEGMRQIFNYNLICLIDSMYNFVKHFGFTGVNTTIITGLVEQAHIAWRCPHKMKSRVRVKYLHDMKQMWKKVKKDKENPPYGDCERFLWMELSERREKYNYADLFYFQKHFVVDSDIVGIWLDSLECECFDASDVHKLNGWLNGSNYRIDDKTIDLYARAIFKGISYREDNAIEIADDIERILTTVGEEPTEEEIEEVVKVLPEPKRETKIVTFQDLKSFPNMRTARKSNLHKRIVKQVRAKRSHKPYWKTERDEQMLQIDPVIRKRFETISHFRISASNCEWATWEDHYTPADMGEVMQLFSLLNPEKVFNTGRGGIGSKSPRNSNFNLTRSSRPEIATLGEAVDKLDENLGRFIGELGSVKGTYRYLIYYYLQFLAKHGDAREAFKEFTTRLLTWGEDMKAKPTGKGSKLHPIGVMFFIAQVRKQGIAEDFDHHICLNRNEPLKFLDLSPDEVLFYIKNTDYIRTFKTPKMKTCAIQMGALTRAYEDEMQKVRLKGGLHNFMFHRPNFLAYMYNYYYPKDDLFERRVFGTDETSNGGAGQSEANPNDGDSPNPFDQNNPESRSFLAKKVKEFYKKFSDGVGEVTEPITTGLNQVYTQIVTILTKMENFLDFCMGKITGFFDNMFGGPGGPVLRSLDLLELLVYYLIYRNVENKLFKGFALIQLLRKMGLLEIVQRGAEYILGKAIDFENWFKTPWRDDERQEEEEEPKPSTSGVEPTDEEEDPSMLSVIVGWFEEMTSENLGKIVALFVVGITTFIGYKYADSLNFKDIGKQIIEKAKNWHFVGAGLFGIERVMKYSGAIFATVSELLKELFSRKRAKDAEMTEKELEKLKNEVVKIDVLLMHYSSHAGMQSIRTDIDKAREAQAIATKAMKLYAESRLRSNMYPDELKRVITGYKKKMLDVLNIVQRVQNVLKPRETPFHVQFTSKPGLGKSTLIGHLVTRIAKEFYPKMGYNAVAYSRNNEDKFWPGYANQPIVIVDEMYPILDAETLVQWLTYISNLPVMVPMAELSEKVTYFDSAWILSNTNVTYPTANGVGSIEAVWRRRHLLVEIDCDDRVIDHSSGKFCSKLFKEVYPGRNSLDFPHLSFNLMRPVDTGEEQYYMPEEILPNGLRRPTTGLKFEEFWGQLKSRQAVLKQEEQNLRQYEKTLDMAEIDGIWEDVIDFYNENEIRVRDKEFFELNKPYADLHLSCATEDDEERAQTEVAVEKEVVELSTRLFAPTTTKEVIKKEYFPMFYVDGNNKRVRFDAAVYIKNDKIHLETHGVINPDLDQIASIYPIMTRKPKSSYDWFARGTYQFSTKPYEITFHRNPEAFGTNEDLEITRLREMIANFEKTGTKSSLVTRLKAKLHHMEHGNTEAPKKTPTNEFNEFVQERFFGFEALLFDRSEGFVQPGGYVKLDMRSKLAHDNFNELYCSLEVNDSEPRLYHSGRFTDYVYDPVDVLLYGNQFVLTQREMTSETWCSYGDRKTGISLYFLKHVEERNGAFWFKWNTKVLDPINQDRKKTGRDRLPDHPINLMCDLRMRNSMIMFNELTIERKRFLLARMNDFKRTSYSWLVTTNEHIRMMRERLGETLERVTPQWVKETMTTLKRTLYVGGALVAVIYIMRQIGALFGGVTPTSKVYHKVQSVTKKLVGTDEQLFPQHEQHLNSILKNMIKVRVNGRESNGLGIIGNMFIMCKHPLQEFLDSDQEVIEIEVRRSKSGEVDYQRARITKDQIAEYTDRDLVAITSSHVGNFKNIIKYFYTKALLEQRKPDKNGLCLVYNNKNGWNRIEFPESRFHESWSEKMHGSSKKAQITGCFSYKFDAPFGSSGGALFKITNDVQCIAGFQCFTDHKYSYASTLTQEDISRIISNIGFGIVNQGPAFANVNEVSPTEELITSNSAIIGTIPHSKVLGVGLKSSFIKTPIYKAMNKSERIPAILDPFDPRVGTGQHPLQHSINKYGRDVMMPLNEEILEHAATQLALYYKNRFDRELAYLNNKEIIRGIPNVEPMNVKTSPGIPWVYNRSKPGKKDYIRYTEEGEIEFVAEEVIEKMEEAEFNLLCGVIPRMSAYEFPKDELRPIEKVEALKTRSISVLPMEFNMLYRKYNGSMDGAIQELADGNNPICIGINPESLSWNEIYNNMAKKNETGMDFDVGNWDGHYPHALKQANNKAADKMYEDAEIDVEYYNRLFEKFTGEKWSFEKEEVRKMISTLREAMSQAVTYGYINFMDIVIQTSRGLKSGYGGTGAENCRGHVILIITIINEIIYEKYGFLIDINELFKYVVVYVYGDDVLLVITEDFLKVASYEEIIDKYRYYGWPITSATKTEEVKPRPLQDLQFLKRQFTPINIKGMPIMIGALEEKVIHDLTYWMRKGKNIEDQFYENLTNAVFFMWAHGREKTEELIYKINRALVSKGMPTLTTTWKVVDTQMKHRIVYEEKLEETPWLA